MNQVSNPVQKSIEKSVVSQVTPNGSWESQHGLLYKYEITMENGQSGDINSKVQDDDDKFGWKVGSEIDYIREQKGKFIAKGTNNTEDVLAVAEIFVDWVLSKKETLPFSENNKAPF
jgi:hypothetical protein